MTDPNSLVRHVSPDRPRRGLPQARPACTARIWTHDGHHATVKCDMWDGGVEAIKCSGVYVVPWTDGAGTDTVFPMLPRGYEVLVQFDELDKPWIIAP